MGFLIINKRFYNVISTGVRTTVRTQRRNPPREKFISYLRRSSITDKSERRRMVTAPGLDISSIFIWVYGRLPRSTIERVSSVVTASTPHPNRQVRTDFP